MSEGKRRLRAPRALTGVLAVLLAALSGYAVLASWHQAKLVRTVAEAGSDTDAYQEAAYLVTREMALVGTLLAPVANLSAVMAAIAEKGESAAE